MQCFMNTDRCKKMLKLQAKGAAIWADEHHWTVVKHVRSSESLKHIIFLTYILRISYQCIGLILGWQHLQKPSLKCNFTYNVLLVLFHSGHHPWLSWLPKRSQTPSGRRQLQTCSLLMHGWVESAGCVQAWRRQNTRQQLLYYKRGDPYRCSAKAPVLEGSGSRRLYRRKGTSVDRV